VLSRGEYCSHGHYVALVLSVLDMAAVNVYGRVRIKGKEGERSMGKHE
jgi:hypothetical protein